jgi:hypothetical protein
LASLDNKFKELDLDDQGKSMYNLSRILQNLFSSFSSDTRTSYENAGAAIFILRFPLISKVK